MSNMRTGYIGWHVMLEDMYHCQACGRDGHVFHENMSYGRTYLVGWHVLLACAEVATI